MTPLNRIKFGREMLSIHAKREFVIQKISLDELGLTPKELERQLNSNIAFYS